MMRELRLKNHKAHLRKEQQAAEITVKDRFRLFYIHRHSINYKKEKDESYHAKFN